MAKEHKKQHFIPQCYLRNFSVNEKFVFIYSKSNTNKGYAQSISNTAFKDYFYTIPDKYLKKTLSSDIDHNYIEKNILADQIEALYSKLLKKILNSASAYNILDEKVEVFSSEERDVFAALIAIQYLRMPNIRNKYWGAQQKAQKERNEIVAAFEKAYKDIECSEALNMNRDNDYAPIMHAELFLDEELIAELKDQLTKKIWIYKLASNGTVFTSDNPILLKPHLKNQSTFYEGFAMKGVEIIFPISKNIILTIWDEDQFSNYLTNNNTFTILTEQELRQYNCYQYIWANDEVFSSNNDFKLIEYLKVSNGDLNEEISLEQPTIKVNVK